MILSLRLLRTVLNAKPNNTNSICHSIPYFTRFAAIQKEKQEAIRKALQLLRPVVCKQLEKIRLGNAFDGGYVVPKRSLQCDVVISIGVGPDVSFEDSELASFEVIVCELHCCDQLKEEAFRNQFSHAIAKLTKNHAPLHLHGNNYGVLCTVEGVPVPAVLELTLLRRDLGDFEGISHEPIPGPLDNPNRPDRPDLCLNPL